MLLSLKNIYRMLMNNDFPIYSESVIAEKNRKGQTLLRFWQNIMAEEFRSLSNGRLIWRNDGKRNRYLSSLCNRSMDLKRYREYSRELILQLNETTLLNQIARFEKFLTVREYRHDILLRRFQEMTRLWATEDTHAGPSIVQQIRGHAIPCDWLEHYGDQGKLFQAAYVLSLMTLYAAAGDAMDDPAMTVLLDERFEMQALWEARQKMAQEKQSQIVFLTNHAGVIQDNPLPRHRFFGREEELYDLQEMASARRKCLISGIGGIGKTELVRQLLRLCTAENTINKIGVIPYETGLAESFYRAFPGSQLQKPEDSFQHILLSLEREAESGQNILLIIDDLDKGIEEDPSLGKLLELPCGVLITTRRSHLEGFEFYRLAPPSVTTGTLIFRDNFGQPLTRNDRELLKEMLLTESLCHPLTLHLMARAARSRGWSVAQMKEHLQKEGICLTWVENEHTLRVTQMYNQLYSLQQIPTDCRRIAELFTLMPSDSYSEEFLKDTFPEILGQEPEEKLLQLLAGGWLDAGVSGYYMHPLVAECLRRKVLTEDRLETVLTCLHRQLPRLQLQETELERVDGEAQRISQILLYIAELLTGSISKGLMLDILNAANTRLLTQATKEDLHHHLKLWWKRCREHDDLTELIFCAVLSNWNLGSMEQSRTIYQKQKAALTVPKPLFWDFCLCAGGEMAAKAQPEAMDLLREALAEDASACQQAMAYYHISGCYQVTGKAELALQWSEQGAKYVTEHPECGALAYFNNLFSLCTQCLTFRKQEQAKQLLDHIEKMLEGNFSPDLNMQLYSLLGLYEMVYGDQEQALAHKQKELQLNQEYFGKDRNHYSLLGTIGDILSKLGRFDEAAANYDECLAYARSSGDRKMLLFKSNNGAVLYLRMGKPLKALDLLQTAVTEARATGGGLMLGEALRNTALAYGQLNDPVKEHDSLRKALPLLLEAYGPDHERVKVASERLEKLNKEFT